MFVCTFNYCHIIGLASVSLTEARDVSRHIFRLMIGDGQVSPILIMDVQTHTLTRMATSILQNYMSMVRSGA